MNGIACTIFLAFILAALTTRTINLGSAIPRVEKAKNPGAYWSVLLVFSAIVAWTGVLAASELLKN